MDSGPAISREIESTFHRDSGVRWIGASMRRGCSGSMLSHCGSRGSSCTAASFPAEVEPTRTSQKPSSDRLPSTTSRLMPTLPVLKFAISRPAGDKRAPVIPAIVASFAEARLPLTNIDTAWRNCGNSAADRDIWYIVRYSFSSCSHFIRPVSLASCPAESSLPFRVSPCLPQSTLSWRLSANAQSHPRHSKSRPRLRPPPMAPS